MAGKFFSVVRDLRGGKTLEELDSAVAEVVAGVRDTNKSGEIVLRLRVRPPKKGTVSYLTVDCEVSKKIPEHDRDDTIFFATPDNGLTRQDPSQLTLGLRPSLKPVERRGERIDTETGEVLRPNA